MTSVTERSTSYIAELVPSHRPDIASRALARLRLAYHAAMPEHRLRRYVGDAAKIRTYTLVSERLCLFDAASEVLGHRDAGGRLLEIGSYLGGSAVVLAEALRREGFADRGRLYCIDTWHNDAMTEGRRDTFDQFNTNLASWLSVVQTIRGVSHLVALPDVEALDLVFIDGDHSYEAAIADIRRFAPLVADHGRLLLHDHRSKPGVAQALGELLGAGMWIIDRCVESLVSLKRAPWVREERLAA